MPQLGETVTEGTITRWLKQVGDRVEADEPLFEVSTDKVDSEVPAPIAGVLSEIRVPEGETADVGTVLAVLAEGATAAPAPEAPAPGTPAPAVVATAPPAEEQPPPPPPAPPAAPAEAEVAPPPPATPAVPPPPAAPEPVAAPAPPRPPSRSRRPRLPPRRSPPRPPSPTAAVVVVTTADGSLRPSSGAS